MDFDKLKTKCPWHKVINSVSICKPFIKPTFHETVIDGKCKQENCPCYYWGMQSSNYAISYPNV